MGSSSLRFAPSAEEFLSLARHGNLIPVYAELLADRDTPVSAFAKLRSRNPAFLFESISGGEQISRYSFIGCHPRKIIACGPESTRILESGFSPITVTTPADPLRLLEEEFAAISPVPIDGMPPFFGGAVGFLGYEYVNRIEPSVLPADTDPDQLPLLYFLFTDTVVIFDSARQTMRICVCAHLSEKSPGDAYAQAVEEIQSIAACLAQPNPLPPTPLQEVPILPVPHGNFERPEFEAAVRRIQEYIKAGDIIQGVLSQRFAHRFAGSPLDLYRALRTINPSPYMFLFETEDFSLIGASPEVHVRLTGNQVHIKPIAGTRPRGKNPAEDAALEKDLLADEKECAEHLMLVDLARNDIGRVCEIGSVQVEAFMHIEKYSHVMHIVSDVTGRIRSDQDAFDLLRATFPAGTVSGAPKIRAMQIINSLEPCCRGPYSGALGYFSYDGNHDSCITIRTAVMRDQTVLIQSGAGVVADSNPGLEYEETINKAKGLLKAVSMAETML